MAKNRQPAVPSPAQTPEREGEDRKQVYLDGDLYRMAGIISRFLDMTRPDYINARLRPLIEAEYREVTRQSGLGDKE